MNIESLNIISGKATLDVVSNENPFSFFDEPTSVDLFSDKSSFLPPVSFAPTLSTSTMTHVLVPMITGDLSKLTEEESNATLRGSWKVIAMNKTALGSDANCSLFMETRTIKSDDEEVDTDLFSSITYSLRQRVTGSFTKHVPFLLTRLQVVDPTSGEEIRKDNKMILSGACESTLSPLNREGGVFETSVKFKFTDVSYHHDKRPFALRVSLFLNTNTDEPILVKQSKPIMVFARKKYTTPATPSTTSRKRKAEEEPVLPAKARKTQELSKPTQSQTMEDFNNKLEVLFLQIAEMGPEDRATAMKKILQELYKADIQHVFANSSSPN